MNADVHDSISPHGDSSFTEEIFNLVPKQVGIDQADAAVHQEAGPGSPR